jgi:excisionase family DNA binding protein
MDRAVLDATDTCFYLRLTAETLRTLVKQRQIPYRQLGTHTLILTDELDSWFQGLPGVSVEEALANLHEAEAFRTAAVQKSTRPPAHISLRQAQT